jgi:hypothetical protein
VSFRIWSRPKAGRSGLVGAERWTAWGDLAEAAGSSPKFGLDPSKIAPVLTTTRRQPDLRYSVKNQSCVVLVEIQELRAPKHFFLYLVVREFRPFDAETPVTKPVLPKKHQFL